MQPDKEIEKWLNDFELSDDEETIHLNNAQKGDLNLFLQKRYNFIQWEQGSGKTLAGIAIGNIDLKRNRRKMYSLSVQQSQLRTIGMMC